MRPRRADVDRSRQIADAVLYEGYLLWPYRRSALKNQQRWTFGGVHPEGWSRGRAGDDPSTMQTQCLLEAAQDTRLDVTVRFLHVVDRQPLGEIDGRVQPVDELEVGEDRYVAWQEATEREIVLEGRPLGELERGVRLEIEIEAGATEARMGDRAASPVGRLVRSWRELRGELLVWADEEGAGLHTVCVRVENTSPWNGRTRAAALEQTFCACHTVLRARKGSFVSITDPPEHAREAAEACENAGTWPVLVGEEGEHDTVLSSPIILPDYPQVAPESPGDLFDSTEIDQMLVLNILSLTDEEKREMRDSDPRAREILERTESLGEDELMRLHGAIREMSVVRRSATE
jgi:hypothetical protein